MPLVVQLDAVRLLRKAYAGITAQTRRAGLLLNHRAVCIDDGKGGSDFVLFVVGLHVVLCVEGNGRQVGQLVELAVVTLTGMTVESHFRHIATRIGRTDVADVAETARHIHVCITHFTNNALLVYQVER